MKKRYVVNLSVEERECLEAIVQDGRQAQLRRRHSQVLLWVDQGKYGPALTDVEAAEEVDCTRRTVEQIRERCVTEGLGSALERKKQSRTRPRKLDGDAEAQLIMLACSDAPEGHARWTLRLLTQRLVEMEIVESISPECVRGVLKKHDKTLAETDVVYSGAGQRSVRLSNGAGARGLQTGL